MSRMLGSFVALAMVAFLTAGPVLAAPPPPVIPPIIPPITISSPWPQFHGDAQHTGQSDVNTTRSAPHLKWSYNTSGYIGLNSPVIGPDGTVYINSQTSYSNGTLFAIRPDGKKKWSFETDDVSKAAPAVSAGGVVYITVSNARMVYAINADGTVRWSAKPQYYLDQPPVLGPDGTIYSTDDIGHVFALGADGTQKWNASIGQYSYSAPTLASDGHVYFPHLTKLYAYNPDGTLDWSKSYSMSTYGKPRFATVDKEGTIYFGAYNLEAVHPDGTEKWTFTGSGPGGTAPAIGPDGTIYFGSDNTTFYAVRPDNTLKWTFPTGASIFSSAAIGSEGTIYFGSNDGKLYALNPDGTLKWALQLGDMLQSSPAIGSDGTIYIAGANGTLFAVGPEFEAPSAPLGLKAAAGPGQVRLDWSAPASDGNGTITGYKVYRATPRSLYASIKELGKVTTYTDREVVNGQEYFYTVTARNVYGEGKDSAAVNATPLSPPSAPLNLTAKAGNKQVKLAWAMPADNGGNNVTGFRIYRGLAGGNLTFLVEVGNVLNYTDAGVQNGKTYTYRITAENAAGEGAPPSSVNAGPKVPPASKAPGFGAAALLAAIIGMAILIRRPRKKD